MTSLEEAVEIIKTLRDQGEQALLVGGAVRSQLLDLLVKDYDIATSATPEKVLKLFPHNIADGVEQGVVKVILGPNKVVDVATFRKDGNYSDGRTPESVIFTTDLKEDSMRRDFTCNSLYLDPITGEIFDFHGGQNDIKSRMIRTVGSASDRFAEDILRIMRAIRFACELNFNLSFAVMEALEAVAPRILEISFERIQSEFFKILASPRAEWGVSYMCIAKIMQEILPEVADLRDVPQDRIHHPEGSVLNHTRIVLDHLIAQNSDVETRFAGLLHDIGKKECLQVWMDDDGRERISNIGHEHKGAEMAEEICDRFKLSSKQKKKICWMIDNHMKAHRADEMRKSRLVAFMRETEFFPQLVELQHADSMGNCNKSRKDFYTRAMSELDLTVKTPCILNGKDLIALGYTPGPEFTEILDTVREHQDGDGFDSKEAALDWVVSKFKK
jgi:poly(A) polymerase